MQNVKIKTTIQNLKLLNLYFVFYIVILHFDFLILNYIYPLSATTKPETAP